jgi:hypothetical protein
LKNGFEIKFSGPKTIAVALALILIAAPWLDIPGGPPPGRRLARTIWRRKTLCAIVLPTYFGEVHLYPPQP